MHVTLFDARTTRVLATVLLYGLVLGFICLAWRTLVAFLFAILFAYLFEPVVDRLQRRFRGSRVLGVTALYLLLLIGLGIFLLLVGPRIVQQAGRLSGEAPALSQHLGSGQLIHQAAQRYGWSPDTELRIQSFLAGHRQQIAAAEQSLFNELGNLAGNALWVALVPVLAIFFLLSGGRFSEALLGLFDRRHERIFLRGLLADIHDVLAHFIRAQITLTGIAVAVYLIAFNFMRLPYATALAVAAGVLEFIPVIGPLLAYILLLLTAFFLGYRHLIALLIFLLIWRGIQDYYNSPHIMGGQVELPPIVVLFGILAGGEMAGIIGVYLSVPVMATLRVIWMRWRAFGGDDGVVISGPDGTA